MKKKIISLGALVISFSLIATLTCTTSSKINKTDISVASVEELKAGNKSVANNATEFDPDFYVTGYGDVIEGSEEPVATTQASNGSAGNLLGNVANNAGNLLSPGNSGGLVDAFGNIVGGILTPTTQPPATVIVTAPYVSTTASVITGNTLIPVPAASQTTEPDTTVTPTVPAGETVDYAATANPYTKPTSDFKAGDRDDTIKWIQWIFIYTRYGLKDNGITGRLDEDTVAVVKKLQQEKGLPVDGNINKDVVDKAELLYLEYTLGADATAGYIEPSAAETLAPADTTTEKGSPDILPIIIIISVLWIVTVIVVFAIFIIKKKKLAKEIEKSEETEATTKKAKDEKNTSGVMSMSDLFEDAGKK